MAERENKPKGLPADFIRQVCWSGDGKAKYCRYLRAFRGVWVCAKGTAAGIRHSERIGRLLDSRREEEGEVVFGSGSDVSLTEPGQEMKIHAGDNCPGRAGEFPDQFPKGQVS